MRRGKGSPIRYPGVRLLGVLELALCLVMIAIAPSCSDDSNPARADGGGGSGARSGSGDYRETFCTAIIGRYVSCGLIEASLLDRSIADCRGNTSSAAASFKGEFLREFAACIDTLACDNLEGADDVCWPVALKAASDGSVATAVLDECAGGSSERCAELVASQVTGSDPVSACLRKWQVCTTASGFTEDDCLSVMAFVESSRDGMVSCLTLDCAAAGQCLRDHGTVNW